MHTVHLSGWIWFHRLVRSNPAKTPLLINPGSRRRVFGKVAAKDGKLVLGRVYKPNARSGACLSLPKTGPGVTPMRRLRVPYVEQPNY